MMQSNNFNLQESSDSLKFSIRMLLDKKKLKVNFNIWMIRICFHSHSANYNSSRLQTFFYGN